MRHPGPSANLGFHHYKHHAFLHLRPETITPDSLLFSLLSFSLFFLLTYLTYFLFLHSPFLLSLFFSASSPSPHSFHSSQGIQYRRPLPSTVYTFKPTGSYFTRKSWWLPIRFNSGHPPFCLPSSDHLNLVLDLPPLDSFTDACDCQSRVVIHSPLPTQQPFDTHNGTPVSSHTTSARSPPSLLFAHPTFH